VVSAGDTIDSIAVAYGTNRAEILALNPTITNPTIIRLGQEILIQEAGPSADEGDTTSSDESDEEEAPVEGINLEAEVEDEPDAEPRTTSELDEETEAVEVASAETEAEAETSAENTENEAPAPTPTVSTATLTPAPVVSVADGNVIPASDPSSLAAVVCVAMFDDANKNRIMEPQESLLPGGSIRLSNVADGAEIGVIDTDGVSEPHCFEELALGTYVAAAQAPADYGLTSPDQLRVVAVAGSRLDVNFGAAQGVEVVAAPPADSGAEVNEASVADDNAAQDSALQDIFGISGLVIFGLAAVVLVAGVGLTLFMRRR
jgi:hypothetical protein